MGLEAIAGSTILAGGTGIASSLINKGASADATAAQLQAQREAIAAQTAQSDKAVAAYTQQANQSRADLQPFRDAQVQALGQLQGYADPNNQFYQDSRNQATQAIQRQLAAQGLLRSKKQTDLLSNVELGLNQQRLNVIGGLAGNGAAQGQSGISQQLGGGLAQLYGNLGQQLGSSFQQSGQTMAQGILGGAQANAQGLVGIGNAIQGGVGNYLAYQNQQNGLAQLKSLLGK